MSFSVHPWIFGENTLIPEKNRVFESLTSIGNGYMGMRGHFEEDYSGDTDPGCYLAGVWMPERTDESLQKKGCPAYSRRTARCVRLNGIHVFADEEPLDLSTAQIESFHREINMKTGVFIRRFSVRTGKGTVSVSAERFVSLAQKELLAIRYSIKADYPVRIEMKPYLDGNAANYGNSFGETDWDLLLEEETEDALCLVARTKENSLGAPRFTVCCAMSCWADGLEPNGRKTEPGYVEMAYSADLPAGETATLEKYVLVFTDNDDDANMLTTLGLKAASRVRELGFDELREAHVGVWTHRWQNCDIRIDGDDEAQQRIRFQLYHLLSTYPADDDRLDFSLKGFTGEGYGGEDDWRVKAFCLPFFLSVAGEEAAKQLLEYRYHPQDQEKEPPTQTVPSGCVPPLQAFFGKEPKNDWELIMDECRRNGAVAHALFEYSTYTGDFGYLRKDSLNILLGIARFFTGKLQDCRMDAEKNPYFNRLAAWCIGLFVTQANAAGESRRKELEMTGKELEQMAAVSNQISQMNDGNQNDGNAGWASGQSEDALLVLYFLIHLFDKETICRLYELNERMTAEKKPVSSCLCCILASQLGYRRKAAEHFHRAIALDDSNDALQNGINIAETACGWLSVVRGFAGMRTTDGLAFVPFLPEGWNSYSFKIRYRGRFLRVSISREEACVELLEGKPLSLRFFGKEYLLEDTLFCSLS